MEQTPKVEYHDLVLRSKGLLSTSQIAKDYGFSAQRLNKLLSDLKIQYKQSGQWLLYSKYQDKGYVKSETYVNDRGVSIVSTKWTQKGRLFIYDLLKSKDIYPVCEQDTVHPQE